MLELCALALIFDQRAHLICALPQRRLTGDEALLSSPREGPLCPERDERPLVLREIVEESGHEGGLGPLLLAAVW